MHKLLSFPYRQSNTNVLRIPFQFENNADILVSIEKSSNAKRIILAICTKAMYRIWDLEKFILFIEYYHLVGVEKFYFYWDSISVDLGTIIQIYKNSGKYSYHFN